MPRLSWIATASALALMAAVPAQAQDSGNVLTLSSEQTTTFVRNFNPFGQTSARYTTLDFMYEPLVVFNRLKSNEPNFRLAESYELADDLMSITFVLREGLKWSDGEPLTADDVIFTYDYITKFPALDFISVSALLESVELLQHERRGITPRQASEVRLARVARCLHPPRGPAAGRHDADADGRVHRADLRIWDGRHDGIQRVGLVDEREAPDAGRPGALSGRAQDSTSRCTVAASLNPAATLGRIPGATGIGCACSRIRGSVRANRRADAKSRKPPIRIAVGAPSRSATAPAQRLPNGATPMNAIA